MNSAPQTKASPFTPETYSAIVRDKRLSHGSFHLFHLLRDYANDEGTCYPGMRRLARELGSNPGRVAKWRAELIAAGYLRVNEDRRRGQSILYRLCGGVAAIGNTSRQEVYPEPATVSVAALSASVAGSIPKVCPQPATKPNPEPNPYNRRGTPAKRGQEPTMARPSLEQVKLHAPKIGLPEPEAEKFFNHYESNGWLVGKNPMRSWTAALNNWKLRFDKGTYDRNPRTGKPNPRNAGTATDAAEQGRKIKAHLAKVDEKPV